MLEIASSIVDKGKIKQLKDCNCFFYKYAFIKFSYFLINMNITRSRFESQ